MTHFSWTSKRTNDGKEKRSEQKRAQKFLFLSGSKIRSNMWYGMAIGGWLWECSINEMTKSAVNFIRSQYGKGKDMQCVCFGYTMTFFHQHRHLALDNYNSHTTIHVQIKFAVRLVRDYVIWCVKCASHIFYFHYVIYQNAQYTFMYGSLGWSSNRMYRMNSKIISIFRHHQ